MHVTMTAPRLALLAVALIAGAGTTLHDMEPYRPAADVAALAVRVGVDDVDLAEVMRRGIIVTRAPGADIRREVRV